MSRYRDLIDSWKGDFRAAYEHDSRNASRQSFEDYWAWVMVFLAMGGAGQRGWLEQAEHVLQRVRDPATAEALRARLRAVGRAIATEWAKDSRARRIHTTFLQGSPNLRDWGKQLERAAARDAGDGAAIAEALRAIESDVKSILDA